MKKYFLRKLKVVLAVVFVTVKTSFIFGQTYVIVPNDSIVDITPFSAVTHFTIQQTNVSGNPLLLSWEQIAVSIPVGWNAFLCDNGNCFPNFPLSGTMDTVSATDYGFLSVGVDPSTISGVAIVQYAVWDISTPNQKDTLTWIITANGLIGLSEENTSRSIEVFPTLANENITIESTENNFREYFISDVNGKVLKHDKLLSNSTNISVAFLPNGIYFISILDINKDLVAKKIIIQH